MSIHDLKDRTGHQTFNKIQQEKILFVSFPPKIQGDVVAKPDHQTNLPMYLPIMQVKVSYCKQWTPKINSKMKQLRLLILKTWEMR